MQKEVGLKYSLAAFLALFLIVNAVLVLLAARGHPLISAQETLPIGIKWLILLGMTLASVGIAFWMHRAFLDAGISPVDTTWVDLVIIAYASLTMIALLFVGEAVWALFAVFLILLFIFTAIVLRKLLNSSKGWFAWLIGTTLLAGLIVIFISTLLPSQ
jgi:hypothetical protein